jgi:hypothetical protein
VSAPDSPFKAFISRHGLAGQFTVTSDDGFLIGPTITVFAYCVPRS